MTVDTISPAPVFDVSVVIPVFNEVEGIQRCYDEVVAVLTSSPYSFELVFVDDGSSDGSTEIMASYAEQDHRVTLVKLVYNVGQQRAMFIGLEMCRGRAIVTFDADLQFHPSCLPELAEKIIAGYDIAGGVRVDRKDPFWLNQIPSYIGKRLINRALQIDSQDLGAVKAYSYFLVQKMLQRAPQLIIIPALAYTISKNMIEIPISHQARKAGKSKWSVFSRLELYLDIHTMYARRPFELMMLGSLFCFVTAFVMLVGIIFYRAFVSDEFSGLIIFFDFFLWVTGMYFFSLSFIGEFVVRIFRGQSRYSGNEIEKVIYQNREDSLLNSDPVD